MKLNSLEFALMNNPVRAASQWWIESPVLIGPCGILAGKRVLEVGCGRGVGVEILLALGATHVTGFDLDPKMIALAQQRVAKYGDRARSRLQARASRPGFHVGRSALATQSTIATRRVQGCSSGRIRGN